jgi:ubiquinone/menaquinone biosynthesis C-methylase UbiE
MSFSETEIAAFYDQFDFGKLLVNDKAVAKNARFWYREFLSLTKDQPIFFDLGCGDGREARLYREVFGNLSQYYGLDLSSGMLGFTRSHSPEAKLVQASFSHLPFADNSLPTVWAAASYLHLDHDQILPALSELYRCLTPGGRGFISLKGHPSQPIPDYNQHLARRYSLTEFNQLLKMVGFDVTNMMSDPNRDSRGITWLGFFFSKK